MIASLFQSATCMPLKQRQYANNQYIPTNKPSEQSHFLTKLAP